MENKEKGGGRVQSVARAFALLEAVGRTPEGIRLSDAAAEVGLSPSTAHNLMATLESLGYVAQPASGGAYVLTARLGEVARSGTAGDEGLRDRYRPVIEKLAAESRETCYLAVPGVYDYLYLDGIDSPHPFKLTAPVGGRDLMLGSAIGHVLLAFRPEAAGRVAARDPEGWDRWRSKVELARKQGYALDLEEAVSGLCCLAVPVREGESVPAAIGIAGPTSRLSEERMHELAGLVRDALIIR
ncbi:IclR family transcriptional regulator [Nocardiopsis rhodophaea]|uniref:IclR family transcriptional regulator n=1 Tax=Nocardiopsis rhodophaea TaxID=280238 RepID=A0ABN2S9L0_9ACTN